MDYADMKMSKKVKRIAGKVVEYNLRKDGWDIIRFLADQPGPSDIHAVNDDKLFIIHINPAVYPEVPHHMNDDQMRMVRYLARKMKANLYSADILLNPDLTVKNLKYRFLET
jgi:hypothetical protein